MERPLLPVVMTRAPLVVLAVVPAPRVGLPLATIVVRPGTLPAIALTRPQKNKKGVASSTRLVSKAAVASIVVEWATFRLNAKNLPGTRPVTIADRKATLPRTAPIQRLNRPENMGAS